MGFTPIDESEIATSAPSFNFTPITDDEIASAPVEEEPSIYDRAMGSLKGIAKGASDIIAAPADLFFRVGNEAIDAVTGEDTDLTGWYPSDFRDRAVDYLAGGEGYQPSENTTKLASQIASIVGIPTQAPKIAASVPVLGKAAESSKLANLITKTIGYGTEGATYGAALNAKSENLLDDTRTGAALNIATPAVLKMTGSLARGLSNKFGNAAEETLEKGLGIQYGDRTKGLNRVNLYIDDAGEVVPLDKLDDAVGIQSPIQQQVKTLEDAGFLANAPNETQALKLHIAKAQKEIGKTIPALAREADIVIGTKEILPEFEATYKFLEGYRDTTRAGLLKEFDSIIDDYANTPGTGLKKLNKFTDQLQKETNFESAIPAAQTKLKRMVQYDLRKAAEREFDAALPNRAGEFAQANAIYSAAENIGKTLNKPLARKSPSLGDYLTGGSLPTTALTGALFPAIGIGPAATIAGGRILKNAIQQYAESAYPISTSNLYKGLSNKIAPIGKAADVGISQSKTISSALNSSQSPELYAQERIFPKQTQPLIQQKETKDRPSFNNTSSSNTKIDQALRNVMGEDMFKNQPVKDVIQAVKSDPVDYAIAKMESNFNPKAKNPNSTASGLFQLIKKTAGSLGVEDVFDAGDNYDGYLKLKQDTIDKFDIDPSDYRSIYASHYLGETAFRRWINGEKLTAKQQAQVEELTEKLFPRLDRYYKEGQRLQMGVVTA